MRTVKGVEREEPLGFLEDAGRSGRHQLQDPCQCLERRRFICSRPLSFSLIVWLTDRQSNGIAKKRQVLINLAPSYFLHMDSTANRASILAETARFLYGRSSKLGHRDRASKGGSSRDGDSLYSQEPTKTFDLKGIQGRKVKASSNTAASKTLFDSEWIEGQCFSHSSRVDDFSFLLLLLPRANNALSHLLTPV